MSTAIRYIPSALRFIPSALRFTSPAIRYMPSAFRYMPSAIRCRASAKRIIPPAVRYIPPAIRYRAPATSKHQQQKSPDKSGLLYYILPLFTSRGIPNNETPHFLLTKQILSHNILKTLQNCEKAYHV